MALLKPYLSLCILMPSFDEEPLDVEMLTEMVNMVNDTELAPEEVLFDRAIAVNF